MQVINPLAAALQAHQAALSSQKSMREAAVVRGQAIRDAITAGYSTKEIAAHLGVSQRRAQAMARTIKEHA